MCGFTCSMFGANYPDGQCIDGFMWDLDSYDGGFLTSGGDIPCPKCNTTRWLERHLEDLLDALPQYPNDPDLPAQDWERVVIRALELNGPCARAFLAKMEPVEFLDRAGRVKSEERPWEDADDEDDDDIILRKWPWPVAGMSQHDRISIHVTNRA